MPVLVRPSRSAAVLSGLLSATATVVLTVALTVSLAVVTLVGVPPAAAVQGPIRINAGGSDGTFEGVAWQADRWAVGGRVATSTDPVSGTTSGSLFQSRRIAPTGYDIPVVPGTYDVTVLTAETYFTGTGRRVFSVRAEGVAVLTDVDLVAVAGHDAAYRVTRRVSVADGVLDVDLSAKVDSAVVSGLVVVPVTTTSPSPAPVAGGPGWTAPTLVDPIVWTPSASNRLLTAPPDRDVLVRWPATAVDGSGGYQISGGRNVVSIGGTIRYSGRHAVGPEGEGDRNRCLYIRGHETARAPRTVHVEGLRCAGPHIWEGINIDSKAERSTLTVQLRDIVMEEVQGLPGTNGSGHIGGDALQTWNGPYQLRVDGFDARNLHYQGIILQPYTYGSGALGQWQLHDVYLEGDENGCAYLMWLSGARSGTTSVVKIAVSEVRVAPAPGKTGDRTLWDRAADWYDVQVVSRP